MSAPVSGMTGFARVEGAHEDWVWAWEARSVNGRNLDVKMRLPPGLDGFEARVREGCARRFRRGSIQVSLNMKREAVAATPAIRVNADVVELYLKAARPHVLAREVSPPRWDGLLLARGVVEVEETPETEAAREAREAALTTGLNAVLDQLLSARREEGFALHVLFGGLFDTLARAVEAGVQAADAQVLAIRDRLHRRAVELLADIPHDPQRLAQEAAAAAMKADVREELDRLAGHVAQARQILLAGGDLGRKLEFLAQEFHREANTLTAKSATLDLTRIGLEMKAAIDQLKEQSANVE
jgi:uncharacterized protein (TIGR00255 family)